MMDLIAKPALAGEVTRVQGGRAYWGTFWYGCSRLGRAIFGDVGWRCICSGAIGGVVRLECRARRRRRVWSGWWVFESDTFAFGLEEADSLMRSVGGGLVVRSLAQVNEPGGWIDHAEPSCGSRGEGVKTGALADTSLASRAVGARLGVQTFDVEAVVTASASSVEGARPFDTLDGLPVLADQTDWSSFDIL